MVRKTIEERKHLGWAPNQDGVGGRESQERFTAGDKVGGGA